MKNTFKGFDDKVGTFLCNKDTKVGDLVTIFDNNAVRPCELDETPCGICLGINNGFAAIQLGGFATINCNKLIAEYGIQHLKAQTRNCVKESPDGLLVNIIAVNFANNAVDILF